MTDFVVGLTGGIASGKSAVATLFEGLGIEVLDADVASRTVVEPGQAALEEIHQRFGDGVLLPDGTLDRVRLRAMVFEDSSARRDLESITHPRIRLLLQQQCAAARGPYAIAAIPLLAEIGSAQAYPWLRRILVVDTQVAMQRKRLVSRDGITPELADRMIAAQATRARRLAIATDVIVNDGAVADLAAPVLRLDVLYRKLSGIPVTAATAR